MFFAVGWAVIRASRAPYATGRLSDGVDLDHLDHETEKQDQLARNAARAFLESLDPFGLDWHLLDALNNETGILTFTCSRNHRGDPAALKILRWLADNASGSYGVVYVHDAEDYRPGFRSETADLEFRVWKLASGIVEETADPHLSPHVPVILPSPLA